MLKIINKTHCWLLVVFVDFQCTPCHKTEAHFNGHVQQWPLGVETVRRLMQVLLLFFLECLDKLEKFVRRLLHAIIRCPLCDPSHPMSRKYAFANQPSSFRRKRAKEAPTPEAITEQKCKNCSENNPAVTYCSDCQRFLCQSCFKFHQRCETLSRCYDQRITRIRLRGRKPELEPNPVLLLFYLVSCFVYYLITHYNSEKLKPRV